MASSLKNRQEPCDNQRSLTSFHMLRHYLTTALRNIRRNKFYSAITIGGLSAGIASVVLIIQYLKYELSYDRFHKDAENIYRVAWMGTNPQTRTPHPMAQAMVRDFPEVENAVSLTPLYASGMTKEIFSMRNPETGVHYDESGVFAVDTTFFKVFSFPMIRGNAQAALKHPEAVLISESTALKYFGTVDCLGKQLQPNDEKYLLQVQGVFKDVPFNSHFHFDFLISYVREKYLDSDGGGHFYQWGDFGHFNYVKLRPGADAKALQAKLLAWSEKYYKYSDDEMRWLRKNNAGFELQPLTSIHLRSHIRWELEPNGNIVYVYLMASAALLILVIGAINFINLNIAQASERAKEIGVRKSLGAFRQQLVIQFFGESLLITMVAIVLSFAFVEIALPLFHVGGGTNFVIEHRLFLVVVFGLGLMLAIVTGIFPALFISTSKPALILKEKMLRTDGFGIRRSLIVFQFLMSMALISSSTIISQQLDFLQHKDIGFKPEEVLVLPVKDRSMNGRIVELRNELLRINGVKGISASSNVPGKLFNQNPIYALDNPQERVDASEELVDADFLSVMDIKLAEGRSFITGNRADAEAFILNETAVRQLGLKDPIGKEIVWERDGPEIKGPVIGVVKDFNFQSLHEPMRPLLIRLETNYNFVVVRLSTGDFNTTIKSVERIWKKFDDRFRFEYAFLDSQLNQLYIEEQNMASVLDIFSVIGMIIACMGLLGIAALAFRHRTKEISVRKVLGATMGNLMLLLLKDFTKLVLIAVILAVPLVWWMMNIWLENFSNRISVSPLVFILTGVVLVLASWITLSVLTVRTARVNPAETLKSE